MFAHVWGDIYIYGMVGLMMVGSSGPMLLFLSSKPFIDEVLNGELPFSTPIWISSRDGIIRPSGRKREKVPTSPITRL